MPKSKYSAEDLSAALDDIKNEKLNVYKAAKTYGIPEQTLRDKIKQKYAKQDGPGRPTVLTATEEKLLVHWVTNLSDRGFPVTKQQLIYSVTKLLKELNRKNDFTNGIPGKHWYKGFLARNPSISQRVTQVLTAARIAATEEKIRAWFARVQQYLEENNLLDILEDPTRIFNCDESAFFLCPKGEGVLARKGAKTVYTASGNNDKENLTVSVGASASGKLMPIFSIFPYKRMQTKVLEKFPKEWAIGKSSTGWMTCKTFYEYITNIFYPFLLEERIKLPVLLFLDGHTSHLSYALSTFCKEKGIILVALLPNSTHIMQPMDVAVFHPLKTAWKRKIQNWRLENNGSRLAREDFGPLLKECISSIKAETVQKGFKACGLYPFDPNSPNYGRLVQTSAAKSTNESTNAVSAKSTCDNEFLQKFNEYLGTEKTELFRQCSDGIWSGDIKDENLFHFWRKLHGFPQNTDSISDRSLNFELETLANNIIDVSDVMNIENDSFQEVIVQPDGSLITSTPHALPSSKMAEEAIRTPHGLPLSTMAQEFVSTPQSLPSSTVVEEITSTIISTENNSITPGNVEAASVITPEKSKTTDVGNSGFPTPFKNALIWPETPKKSVPKRNLKRVIPTVAIASNYVEHQRRIEEAKKIKLEKAAERQKLRELKKNTKESQTKPAAKKGKKKSEIENASPNIELPALESISIGDYVKIVYEEEKFPGIVTKIIGGKSKKQYEVKTMQMCGSNWRWPDEVDILVYDAADVLKKLETPVLCNNRGVYAFKNFNS